MLHYRNVGYRWSDSEKRAIIQFAPPLLIYGYVRFLLFESTYIHSVLLPDPPPEFPPPVLVRTSIVQIFPSYYCGELYANAYVRVYVGVLPYPVSSMYVVATYVLYAVL